MPLRSKLSRYVQETVDLKLSEIRAEFSRLKLFYVFLAAFLGSFLNSLIWKLIG